MASFDNMPLVALINNKFLCLHGGISPDLKSVSNHKIFS
jgi:serine/threonine-protein phosphatase 2B catalytic subunit